MPTLRFCARLSGYGLLLGLVAFSSQLRSDPQHHSEQELAQVQKDIRSTEQRLQEQQHAFSAAEKQLQQADQTLANAGHQVRQQQQALDETQRRLDTLEREQAQLQQQFDEQQQRLAEQLRSAYQLGQHDYTQMLLNQQDAAQLERVLVYYQYFNRARMQQLQAIETTATQLLHVQAELKQQQQQLTSQLARLQQRQQQLQTARQEQQQVVQSLQALLQEQGRQLEYLRQNESSLQATIDALKAKAQEITLEGLTALQGQLQWPLQGHLLQRYNQAREGGLRSRGILIAGQEGAEVNAIANGQVIYADWLKGYGWVLVLDHGEGFMSLYGHNQGLLKTPGEQVAAGEQIALVGRSGGQASAGVYFEIRDKGEAVNPLSWLQSR